MQVFSEEIMKLPPMYSRSQDPGTYWTCEALKPIPARDSHLLPLSCLSLPPTGLPPRSEASFVKLLCASVPQLTKELVRSSCLVNAS